MTNVDVPASPPAPPMPFAPPPLADPGLAVQTSVLTKRYGSLYALSSMSLEIPKGAVYGLIGPNGAGKTTTFSILATLLLPTSGWVRVAGHDPVTEQAKVRAKVGYMPDIVGTYDNLLVGEYLRFFALSFRVPTREVDNLVGNLLELVDLTSKRDAMVNSLSRGMKQRLSLARALVNDPEVLILDEPASGLDPRARIELRDLIANLQRMGKTILISSHILPELQEMCDTVGIMEMGRLLASGTPEAILAQMGAVRRVHIRFADGAVDDVPVRDDAEAAALLRRIVVEYGRDVVEFREIQDDLESVFMRVTEGRVQ